VAGTSAENFGRDQPVGGDPVFLPVTRPATPATAPDPPGTMRTTLAALSTLAFATVGAVLPAQQIVTLWTDSGYSGFPLVLPLPPQPGGLIPIPSNWNDEVTSMQWNLQPGTVLYFYEHSNGTGREYVVTHDAARQGGSTNVGSYYNDKFSSMRWATVDASQGWVRFFTNINKGGYQLTRYLSLLGGSEIDLNALGYNDQVDSIQWSLPSDKTVMCFDEDPAGGKALALINTGQYNNLDAGQSGLYHDNLSVARVMTGQFTSALVDRNRPIDQVCMLRAHNSHVNTEQGWVFWYQQNMSILKQLDYGVRSINLDVREENGQLLLVHGSVSQSTAARAGVPPEPLGPTLNAIHSWLQAHPDEVIYLDFQNDAGMSLTNTLNSSVLAPMFFRPDHMHWPSVNELVAMGKRVILVNTVPAGEQLYPWSWAVENGYSNLWTTSPRSESDPIDGKHRSLFMMNNISGTNSVLAWLGNSPNDLNDLINHVNSFAQIPTEICIDGVEMADHAGLEICRWVNVFKWNAPIVTATAYRFYSSCNGATDLTSSTLPKIGSTHRTYAAPFHVLVTGFDDTSANGVALPTWVPGITTCSLRVSLDLFRLADGFGRVDTVIPLDAALMGATLFHQAVELTPTNWPLSNGVAARVGY